MKTSNIILTAIFVSILVWIFAAFLTAKNKMHDLTEQMPKKEKKELIEELTENVTKLEDFNTLEVRGDGKLGIMQFSDNNMSMSNNEDAQIKVENNILYVNLENDKRIILRAKDIKNILIIDKASINIHNLSTDTLKINTKGKAEINVQSLEASYLKLKTEDKSEVHFHNINKTVPEADFEIKDKSEVTINNTRGMSISVKKGADAKYKDN